MSMRVRPCAVRSACSICRPSPSRATVPDSLPVIVPGEPAKAISDAASMPATLACHWNCGTSPERQLHAAVVAAAEDAERQRLEPDGVGRDDRGRGEFRTERACRSSSCRPSGRPSAARPGSAAGAPPAPPARRHRRGPDAAVNSLTKAISRSMSSVSAADLHLAGQRRQRREVAGHGEGRGVGRQRDPPDLHAGAVRHQLDVAAQRAARR